MMDQREFEKIYQDYYSKIYGYIKNKISHTQDAEELAGDVFTNLYKRLDSYEKEKSSISTWLYVITNNRLKNYYRDKKELVSLEAVEEMTISDSESPENICMLKQMREDILEGLRQLSSRERSIIILKYYQGKSSLEIGKELNLTSGNVRIILKRSLEKLKLIMERQRR